MSLLAQGSGENSRAVVPMSGGGGGISGAASLEGNSEGGGSADWRRIYDRVDALLPRVAALAADRARLEVLNRTQRDLLGSFVEVASMLGEKLDNFTEASISGRDTSGDIIVEASRGRWKKAYMELPFLANPKTIELEEKDLKDSRKREALFDLEMQLKGARRHVDPSETNVGYEDVARDLRRELRELKQAYETMSSNKDREATEAAQKLQQNIEDLQVASLKKDDAIGFWKSEAVDAKTKLRAMEKDMVALLKIKEVEGAQATEATHKLQKIVEDLQVAARSKDDGIHKLQAEALAAKNKLLVAECKLDEMHSLAKEKTIQKLKDGKFETHKRRRVSLPNCGIMAPKEVVFKMRFAAKRLRRVVDNIMNDSKRAIIACSPFKDMLNIAPFAAPMELIEFVAMNTNPKIREFRFKGKSIVFTRDMVVKVLGVPCGNRPLDALKRSEQSELRDFYKSEKCRTTMARAIEILETCDDTDEATVVQSFGLVAFGTVLSPGTGNNVRCEYLGSLMDINEIDQYAIDEHILSEAMKEVELFQEKMRMLSELDASKIHWIGGCLPMLATIYMDFLSFPALAPEEHTINYGVPRFCFVCDANFRLVVAIDKNKMSLLPAAFGSRPLLPLSWTLYAAVAPACGPPPGALTNEGDAEMGSEDVVVNPSEALLPPMLDKGLPSSQHLNVPTHLEGLYNKHNDLYAAEVDTALNNFGLAMKRIDAKRMAALLVDVHTANVASSSFTIPCPLSSTQPTAASAPQHEQAMKTGKTIEQVERPAGTDCSNKVQLDEAGANVVMEAGPTR